MDASNSHLHPIQGTEPFKSIEEVLAGLAWVRELTDASLAADRVHHAFVQAIFSFPQEDDAEKEDSGATRFVTAAEREKAAERDRRLREEARRELEELRNDPIHDHDDDISPDVEEEEDEEDVEGVESDVFMQWIEAGASDHFSPLRQEMDRELQEDLEFKLEKYGLGKTVESAVRDARPERLATTLGETKRLADGGTGEFVLSREVCWMLRQLRRAGQPLAHNTRICALASRPLAEIADEPVVVALSYALEKMTVDHLEPGHLMMYHQTPLHPLLCALLEGSALAEDAKHSVAASSYAYNVVTGQRQVPAVSESYVGFDAIARHCIGEGDPLWSSDRRQRQYAQRKPCFIELGRLLVRLTELDRLFRGLEHRRQRMVAALKDHPDARVQDQRIILSSIVFESSVEADIWLAFVDSLQGAQGSDPYLRVRELGLEDAFEEFSITGLQYQENLRTNTAIMLCPVNEHTSLHDWAHNVGRTLARPLDGDQILSLFTKALVSQFSKLPVLASMVMEVFCAEGDLVVTYRRSERQDQIFSLASVFTEHAQYFLELLEMERNDLVKLYFVLDEKLVYDILNLDGLYQRREDTDWYGARHQAMKFVVIRLLEILPTQVRAQLTSTAEYVVSTLSAQRLSLFCSQAPYMPTRLYLSDFDGASHLWEPQWNVVEALSSTTGNRDRSRVCAVYRGNNTVTAFAFIDERGNVLGTTRWVDCAMGNVSGRERAVLQAAQLRRLFLQCRPTVVAIGASSMGCLPLLRTLEAFVREQVQRNAFVDVPVVWASVEVARYFSSSTYARAEFPHAENIVVTGVALARYVQDPLQVLCALFDGEQTALQLCRTTRISSSHDRQLYQRLAWETSLWMAAVGMWLDDIVFRPNAVAMLQFIPGLGPAKARAIADAFVNAELPHSRAQLGPLLEMYGSAAVRNATPAIRVWCPEESAPELPWHPLDVTLIPSPWYRVAVAVARATAATSALPSEALLVGLLEVPLEERRAVLYRVDVSSVLSSVKKSGMVEIGRREVELVVDELIANGASFARRPYRRLTNVEFMSSITGITYLSSNEGAPLLKMPGANGGVGSRGTFVVREGDYVTGTVTNVRGGTMPGIRLITARGVKAYIAAVDIRDEALRVELLEYIRRLEQQRDWLSHGNDEGGAPSPGWMGTPAWLRRGALLQGTVRRCLWSRCELHLVWCPPKEEDSTVAKDNQDGDGAATVVSYGAIERLGASSSANSLNTAQVQQQVRVFATKMSRHPLFRDVSKTVAAEMLRDKEIGEALLRPRSSSVHRVVCEVKVGGGSATHNWVISERRRPDGQLYYRVEDKVVDHAWEFTDVDDFLCNFVSPMVKHIQSIRAHRRFEDGVEYVQAALDAQREVSGGFAYVFAETESRRHTYQVFSTGGRDTYHFPLHVTGEYIYIQLPFSSEGRISKKWVRCGSAEKVSETVKNYAKTMSQRSATARLV